MNKSRARAELLHKLLDELQQAAPDYYNTSDTVTQVDKLVEELYNEAE